MGIKIITKHKRASYDYFIIEKFEAGMSLKGTEIKSLRLGKGSVSESHITIDGQGEVWANNIIIPHYEQGNRYNHEENRKRKLLLRREEIEKIHHRMKTEKLSLIPLAMYFKDSLAKLEIALAKGKKLHDKRADLAEKDINRKIKAGQYE